jgi:hypothetical protein
MFGSAQAFYRIYDMKEDGLGYFTRPAMWCNFVLVMAYVFLACDHLAVEHLCVKTPNEKSKGWKCSTLLFQMALVGQTGLAIFFAGIWIMYGRQYPDYSNSPGVTNKGFRPLLVHGPIALILIIDFMFNRIIFKPAHIVWHLFQTLVWLGVNTAANYLQGKDLSILVNYT